MPEAFSMKPNEISAEASATAIEFRNVSLSFDGTPVLRDVSFTLPKGEMVVLTGASGSGKSVLMRLAIGLLRPDEGQIYIAGREIDNLDEEHLLAIRGGSMGMVFQEDALFTGMTLYENAAFRLVEQGWPEDKIGRVVSEVLEFVGLLDDKHLMPAELSGGMKRRLEIARALVGWPSIMLYDEPTYALDPLNAGQVLDLIIRARDVHQISSLYVTKELHEIPYLATRRALIGEKGNVTVIDVGEVQELPLRVMLLEDGEIVFFDTRRKFETSALPVVTHMTRPESDRPVVEFYIPDPWSRKRKPRERIL
jgi:phospholipid/cholesterol/gamma-HCH transport system ATP-binding protein